MRSEKKEEDLSGELFRNRLDNMIDQRHELVSLIETAKANYQEPYRYLCWLLNKLPETAPNNMESLGP